MVPADISFRKEMYIRYPLNVIWSCIVHSVAICTHPHSLKLFGLSYFQLLDAFHHLLSEANTSSICWSMCWFERSSDLRQKEQRFAVIQVITVFSGLAWQRQQGLLHQLAGVWKDTLLLLQQNHRCENRPCAYIVSC